MIKDIREETNFLCRRLYPYLKDTGYFVIEICHDRMIIFLDCVYLNISDPKKLKTTYVPFYIEEYKIQLI